MHPFQPPRSATALALAAIVLALALAGHAGASGRADVVSGRVLLDGEPEAGAVVEAYDESRTELAMLDATLCLEHGKRCYEAEEALAALPTQPRRVATTRTGVTGEFELRGLRASALSLWARDASGRRLAARTGVVTGSEHTLRLRAATSLPLATSDGIGVAVPHVPVRAFPIGSSRWFSAETGPDGEARLEHLPAGRYVVVSAHPGLLMAAGAEVIAAEGGRRARHIELARARPLAGRVEREGAPAPDVEVRLLEGGPEQTVRTDANGRFVLERVRDGGRASLEAYTSAGETSGIGHPGAGPEPVVALHPSGAIEGTVLDELDLPVGEARFEWSNSLDQSPRSSWSDANGRFRLAPVLSGRWRIQVTAEGFADAIVDSPRVFTGRTASMRVALRRTTGIAGRVLDPEGRAVPGARISTPDRTTVSRPDGSFLLHGLEPGRNTLQVAAEGSTGVLAEVDVPGPDVVLQLGGATLRGRILAEDRSPVAGAEVHLHSRRDELRRTLASTRTDRLGWFELFGVANGGYQLEVVREDDRRSFVQTMRADLTVPRGTALPLELSFDRGHRSSGRVLDPAGWPIAGADVSAMWEKTDELIQFHRCGSVERSSEAHAKTTADGSFVLEHLLPGPHVVYVRTDAASATLPGVMPDRDGVELRLEPPTLVRGRVLDEAGRVVRRLSVVHRGRVQEIPAPRADGRFELEARGPDTLELRVPGEWPLRVPIEPAPGRTTDLGDLRLPPRRDVRVRIVSPAGQAVPGAELEIDDGSGYLRASLGGVSGFDGLVLLQLPPEGAQVHVSHRDHAPRLVPLRPDLRLHELRLETGASLVGSVTDVDGFPVSPARLDVRGPVASREAEVDESGKFSLDHLEPGEHRIYVRHKPERGEAELHVRPAAILVPPAGVVRADLVEARDGAELEIVVGGERSWGVRTVVLVPGSVELPVPIRRPLPIPWDTLHGDADDRSRRWTFRHVEPGIWTVLVVRRELDASSYFTATRKLAAGSRVRWDVELPRDLPTEPLRPNERP